MTEFSKWLNEQLGIPALEYRDKYDDLKSQFVEMAQLKSDFDMEKFTVMSKGGFIAHQFHMLMRQYSLALYEVRRMTLDREEHLRNLAKLEGGEVPGDKYQDVEIARLKNEIDLLELSLVNKLAMISHFEKLRLVLIDKNGGEITNEQYQAEEPEYWEWNLKRLALEQLNASQTGIDAGVWQSIQQLEEPAPLTPEYQGKMLDDNTGTLDFWAAKQDIFERLDMPERAKKLAEVNDEIRKIQID